MLFLHLLANCTAVRQNMPKKKSRKKTISAFLGTIVSDIRILLAGFLLLCITSITYLNKTSVALLELENPMNSEVIRIPDSSMSYLTPSFNLRSLYMANIASNLPYSNLSKVKRNLLVGVQTGSAFISNFSSIAPIVPVRLPQAIERSAFGSREERHWPKKRWQFELASAYRFVLEQVTPEHAIPYGRHYTEIVRNRSRPLRPGTAAVSDAASLAALSPADFASIKRIWIWGGPPTSLSVA